ncbi:hypothetical protein evm_014534 [Chilo suppressalis]|nr:hypothetical protein evm_014534 [Chilo suppressalis]
MAEAPAMGQFLLPLLSAEPNSPDAEHFLIRHEDILQLLASAEDSVREELPVEDEPPVDSQPDMLSDNDMFSCEEEAPITPEEEAALLHYVCEGERSPEDTIFKPVEEWLLGVYHSWCEISALMYTLRGTNMSVEMMKSDWIYRARFPCHCRLCVCLADNSGPVAALIREILWALAHETTFSI